MYNASHHRTFLQLSQLTILWHTSGIKFKGIILTLYLMRFLLLKFMLNITLKVGKVIFFFDHFFSKSLEIVFVTHLLAVN